MRSAVLWVVAGSAQGTRSTWAVSGPAVMSRTWDLRKRTFTVATLGHRLSPNPDCAGDLHLSEGK